MPISESISKEALRIFQSELKSKYYPLLNSDTTLKTSDEIANYTYNILKNITGMYYSGLSNLSTYKTAQEAQINLFVKFK